MPKPTKGPRLGGSSSHQKAMLANLATALFEHGRIKTTEPKARALRPYAEKLITHAKKGTLHNRREVLKKIRDKDVVHALFAEIGPFFADRDGGYTRIIKVENRKGDNAPMAVIELVQEKTVTSEADRARRVGALEGRCTGTQVAAAAPKAAASRRPSEVETTSRRPRTATDDAGAAEAGAARKPRTLTSPDLPLNDVPAIDTDGGRVRLRLDIAYDGTEFAGWATQSGQRTVAGVLEESLSTVFRSPLRLRAAGRTDTGVHATGQVAHVDVPVDALPNVYPRTPRPNQPEFQPLVRRLGRLLPADVRVRRIIRAPAGFDARFSALRRHYVYRHLHRRLRGGSASGPLHHRLAAAARRRRDDVGITEAVGAQRLRRVLPAPRRGDDDPRPAAVRLGARRRSDHRARHRRRVLLVDGAIAGRRAAGRRRAPAHSRRGAPSCSPITQRSSDYAAAPARGLTLVGVDYPPDSELQARTLITRDMRTRD